MVCIKVIVDGHSLSRRRDKLKVADQKDNQYVIEEGFTGTICNLE